MAAPDQYVQPLSLPRKKRRCISRSVHYEYKLAALVALRARAAGLTFHLYSNVRCARPFGDLVLHVLEPRQAMLLVQIKNREKPVSTKNLVAKTGAFSILKKFDVFYDASGEDVYTPPNKKRKTINGEPPLTKDEEILKPGAQLVMYTNSRVGYQEAGREQEPLLPELLEDLLLTGNGGHGDVFRFGPQDQQVWNLKQCSKYREFLDKLVVFNNQRPYDKIDDKIREEIDKAIGYSLPSVVDKYINIIEEWAQEDKMDNCLSKDLPQLGKAVSAALRDLAVSASFSTLLRFEGEHCKALRTALRSERPLRVILNGVPHNVRAAKVLQVIHQLGFENWTYLDATIARQFKRAKFDTKTLACKVLVLNADGDPDVLLPPDEWAVAQLVQLCSGPEGYAEANRSSVQEIEDDCKMEHLIPDSQEQLLGRDVLFQGRRVPLRDLEGAWPRLRAEVDGALLGALARGEAALGAAPPAPDDEGLHVPRKWEHHALLDPSVLEMDLPTEHLVLRGIGEEVAKELRERCRVAGDQTERWTLLPAGGGEAAFHEVWKSHRNKNVHWVQLVSGRKLEEAVLQWRATRGQEAALAPFVRTWGAQCERRPLCAHEGPPWGAGTLLLVGAPGAGKTCALRRAAAEAGERAPGSWAIYVELLAHRALLRKLPPADEIQLEHAVDLLAAAAGVAASSSASASRRHLEAALSVRGGVSVFMDGVDEVSPFFKERVLRLLVVLKQNPVNLVWVSCRPEVEASLLQELGCPATNLHALSREEQRDYLCQRWAAKHNKPASEFSSFADKTIAVLSQVSEGRSFLDVPLHLSMAAKEFEAGVSQSADSFSQENVFLLLQFYRNSVKMKRDIYLKKQGLVDTFFENLNMRDDFEETHQKCAILSLFSDLTLATEHIENLKTYVEKNIEKLKKEKSGMLWVDEENNMHFVHFTFAEYFSALWLFENRDTQTAKTLTKYLHLKRHETLALRFLDLMLVYEVPQRVQLPLHEALLAGKGDGEGVARALQEGAQVDAVDAGGRTALHLAASSGNWRAMEALLKAGCDGRRPDPHLGWTPLQYAQCWGYVSSRPALRLDRRKANTSPEFLITAHEKKIHKRLCRIICEKDYAKVALMIMGGGKACWYGLMIHCAVEFNGKKVARTLLHRGARACSVPHNRTPTGNTGGCPRGGDHQQANEKAMVKALTRGHEKVVLELLEHVADVDGLRTRGEPVVHLAAERLLLGVTKWLIKKGVNTRAKDSLGREPLHRIFSNDMGCRPDDTKLAGYVKKFLAVLPTDTHFDRTNALDKNGRTPLHFAVDAGHVIAAKELLSFGSDANIADIEKSTPLHMAVKKSDVKMVEALVDTGADPTRTDKIKQQPLTYLYSDSDTTEESAKKIAEKLLDKGADINCRNEFGHTLIHGAVACDHLEVAVLLLKFGAQANAIDKAGRLPLHSAKSKEAVHLLMKACNAAADGQQSLPDVNVRDMEERTPLHTAVSRGNVEVIKALLDYGANVNSADARGRTSLHIAVLTNSAEAVKLLLGAGADPAALDKKKKIPLRYLYKRVNQLIKENCDSILDALLAKGCSPNIKGKSRKTLLHHAVFNDHLNVVERLLVSKAHVDVTDKRKKLPLHYAMSAGGVNLLLRDGACRQRAGGKQAQGKADANARDKTGRSPLHLAAERKDKGAVEALLAAGSDPNATDNEGWTPLDLARRSKHKQVVDMLSKVTSHSSNARHRPTTSA